MSAPELALVQHPAALEDLAPEWHALWRRAGGRFAESPLAGRLAWSQVVEPAGGRLALLVARRDGELVLALPMTAQRRGPLRVLRPLGPGAADSTGVVLDPVHRSEAEAALAEGWRRLTAGADVVQLPGLPRPSALHTLVAGRPATRTTTTDVRPLARAGAGETFEQYGASLGTLSHSRVGGLRRRLARTGEVRVEVADPGDPGVPDRLDWLLQRKQEWARRAGRVGPWLFDPAYRSYLLAALAPGPGGADDGEPAARMLVLTRDGVPVAGAVLGLGATLVEGLVLAYDPAVHRYSPGLIVVEACIEWAFGQGLGLDLGVGSEPYKQYWSRGDVEELVSLQVPLNRRGRLALNARDAARHAARLAERIPLRSARREAI